jgi:hypothetical protein
MTATASEKILEALNGAGADPILQIGRKGRRRVQFGDLPVFEVDVIAVSNAWSAMDRQFRDDKGDVVTGKSGLLTQAAYEFVKALSPQANGHEPTPEQLTLAMALEFLAAMTKEAIRLQRFFKVTSEEESSSPAPSASIVYESMPGPSES